MNSKDNLALIDSQSHTYFITTYATYFAEHLAGIDPKHFAVLDTSKNRRLKDSNRSEDLLCAFRTNMEIWGRECTVIVTFNPVTRRKKLYDMTKKLDRIRTELLAFRQKYRAREPQWRNAEAITNRYRKLCEELHISHKFYTLTCTDQTMSFRKNTAEIEAA